MKLRFVLPPVLLLLSGGCASNQKVGGQYLPVELRTEPPAQRAYLVPSTRWSDGMMDNPSGAVSRYAVDAGGPVNRRVVDMPYVFVAEWEDGRRRQIEVDPAPNSPNVFVLRPQ